MMLHAISVAAAMTLSIMLGMAGIAHFCFPQLLCRVYPGRARTLTSFKGALRVTSAVFLAVPETRIWGGGLCAAIAFVAVVSQLKNARYGWAVPGMIAMMAVPLAMASGPLS